MSLVIDKGSNLGKNSMYGIGRDLVIDFVRFSLKCPYLLRALQLDSILRIDLLTTFLFAAPSLFTSSFFYGGKT